MKKSTKLFMAFGAMMMIGSMTTFAQKTLNLGITATATPTSVNLNDTCFFNIKITNSSSGAVNLVPTDTLYIGLTNSSQVFSFIPTGTVTPGNSIDYVKALSIKHTFDTFTVDHQLNFCFKISPQSSVTIDPDGNGPLPARNATVTYTDPVASNDSSCTAPVTFKKKPTVGIFEFGRDKEQLTVFPNPATDLVKFELNLSRAEKVQVSVKDITGREVMFQDFGKVQPGNNAPLSLDVSRLRAGMYIIELNGEEKRAVGKFTKR
jgi:hypothetical protein